MDKSIAVQQLALPPDIVDHICSFIFYEEIDVILRNVDKYNIVINECKRVRKEQMPLFRPNIVGFYYILPIYNQLMCSTICRRCGNYVKSMHPSTFIICKCEF